MSRMPPGGLLMQPPQQIAFTPIMLPPDQLLLLVAGQMPGHLTPREAVARAVDLAAEVVVAVERGDIDRAIKRVKKDFEQT